MDNNKVKYIYIGIGITVLAIIIFACLFFIYQNKKVHYNTLVASDKSCQIDVPTNIDLKTNENTEFIVDLYSLKDEIFFYVTKIAKSREIDFYQIVNDDKENYFKDKENIREDSGIVSFELSDYTAYEYNFVYYDSSYSKDFYCNVLWVETNQNLYILNFEVVNDNKDKYKDIFLNIKNSFIEL